MSPISDKLRHLERYVLQSSRERGKRYASEGRVDLELVDGVRRIDSAVRGAEGYKVRIALKGKTLHANCFCKYFEQERVPCKHIWATLLVAAQLPEIDFSSVQKIVASNAPLDVAIPAPSAVPVPIRRDVATDERWRESLRRIRTRAPYIDPIAGASAPAPEILLYAIGAGFEDAMHVAFYSRSRRKNGELGAPRKVRLTSGQIEKLPPLDQELFALVHDPYESRMSSGLARFLIPRLAETGRLFLERQSGLHGPLRFDPETRRLHVTIRREEKWYQVRGTLRAGSGDEIPLARIENFLTKEWFVHDSTIARIEEERSPWFDELRRRDLIIPLDAKKELAEVLAAAPPSDVDAGEEFQFVTVEPEPVLRFWKQLSDQWRAEFTIRYGEEEVLPESISTAEVGEGFLQRHREKERRFAERLRELPFRQSSASTLFLDGNHLPVVAPQLASEGWHVAIGDEPLLTEGELELELDSGIDWFDLHGGVTIGDQTIGLPKLLEALRDNQRLVTLENGGVAFLDPAWMETVSQFSEAGAATDRGLRLQRNQVMLLDAAGVGEQKIGVDEAFTKLRDRLAAGEKIAEQQEPPTFKATLRHYQRVGLGWLLLLRELGFGGCLADDMGLGKTVQALALLDHIHDEVGRKPSLVVAPRSLMFNWKAEATRFAPRLNVLDHHGIERIRSSEHLGEFDLILTTYATLQRDLDYLKGMEFEYVILDEAQAVKNASSQSSRAVRSLKARHRLALSGTPIENHLGELWSLFDFLNPGMLGTARAFGRTFGKKTAPLELRQRLARIVRPFILRRTKEMVLPELPDKSEETLWVELSTKERSDYEELRDHYREALLGQIERVGLAKSKFQILEALLRLRQAALHPGLIDPERKGEGSAKLEALMSTLPLVVEEGHKVVVFSQFTSLLDIVEDHLRQIDFAYVRLDGRSRDRESLVRRFQEDAGIPVFLVSLRAGGVGLNLTAADYVYLLDPWWNPAVEAQAIDRTHRIGQTRKVTATRIVASDTVEEKILELQSRKKMLADSIITADDSGILRKLEREDLEHLLS